MLSDDWLCTYERFHLSAPNVVSRCFSVRMFIVSDELFVANVVATLGHFQVVLGELYLNAQSSKKPMREYHLLEVSRHRDYFRG